MKTIFTLLLAIGFFAANAQVDGTLDNGFGNVGDGTSVNDAGAGRFLTSLYQKLIVLPNKKIVQVFSVSQGGAHDFGIAKYDSVGNLDLSFGNQGIVTTDIGGDDYATSVAVEGNGNITVGGFTVGGSATGSFALARYDSLGALVPSFGTGGIKVVQISQDDKAYSLVIEPGTGKIILAGFSSPNPLTAAPTQIAMARFTSNGSLDPSFGTGGKVLTATNSKDNEAYSVALQPNGKIVVAGDRINTSSSFKEFLVLRYTSAGTLDPTFGGGAGFVSTKISTLGADFANSVALQSDGMILAAGSSNNGTQPRFALVRYDSLGVLDNSFYDPSNSPVHGEVVTTIGSGDTAYTVMQQLDKKILVAGSTYNGANSDFAVARYNTNGTLDVNFGDPSSGAPAYEPQPGVVAIAFTNNGTPYQDVVYSMGAQGTKLIIGGISSNNLALARLFNSSALFDPLPVSLYSFTGTKENNSVLLQWQTASELNTKYFDIQRSSNGINFVSIGKVPAAGISNSEQKYAYLDQKPISPNSFYRLHIVDNDNKESFSKILSIRFDEVAAPLMVFPNPVRDALNVQINSTDEAVLIQLFDASGKLVKTLNLKTASGIITTSIDMSGMQRGIYFIKINARYVKVVKE